FTDVARVANAARNYEILHERDNDDAERPDKSPGVPMRATPTLSALRVDADTQESVVELLNTMLRSTVVHIELSLVTFMHLSLFIMVPYRENLCRAFLLCKHVPYCLMAVKVF
nr:hypothetical protein [Tanacetum cinerariifolium]GFB53357.1 hypothetical protein [Tanacetum cinerariifolium]